jgi:hypothetical protein
MRPEMRALLRLGPFRRYLVGQTLSGFGDSLMPAAGLRQGRST